MSKYTIEGNIDFQTELYKLLDEDSDDEETLCQISGVPLTEKYITLECNHKFNYTALYKEIFKQKFVFKTYNPNLLTKKDQLKIRNSKIDYFIKCPYCRNIQFTLLPYYEELELEEIYGINSINEELVDEDETYEDNSPIAQPNIDHTFKMYGVDFKFGDCCEKINNFGDMCKSYYSTTIPDTQLSYCSYHYRQGLIKHKKSERKILYQKKMLIKKEKEDKLIEKKKLLEEINVERALKGLSQLKRLPIKNMIETNNINVIKPYIPEEDVIVCKTILKTGPNKGNVCGCKKIIDNGLCMRHSLKHMILCV
jgi:hypothetical protein